MPTYDYTCKYCKTEIDIIHDINDTKRKCPTCGKLGLKRAWRQVAAVMDLYSPMHPRKGRGRGNTGKFRNIKKDIPGK